MTEQAGVAVSGVSEPHLKFPLGSEVQLKSLPGFGYTVTAAIKNERALMAMDGSCLGLALVHEIEPYCDIDQAHFVSKASKVLWDLGARDASEIAAKKLYEAGARFPEAAAKPPLDDATIANMVGETARRLLIAQGYTNASPLKITDESLINIWYRDPEHRFAKWAALAVEIVSICLEFDVREKIEAVYPRPDADVKFDDI